MPACRALASAVLAATVAASPSAKWTSTTEQAPWTHGTIEAHDPSSAAGKLTTVTSDTFQSMMGFGACFNELGWEALQTLSEEARQDVLKKLFAPGEMGLTYNRVPIGASDYGDGWYSHDEMPEAQMDLEQKHFTVQRDEGNLIPYIHDAQKYMQQGQDPKYLFASAWSPPQWMKLNHQYSGCGKEPNSLNKSREVQQSYAQHLSKFVTAYGERGINVTSVMVQNEPYAAGCNYPKCEWTGAEMRDFIKGFFGPQFEKEHGKDSRFPSEVWLGTLNTDNFAECPETVYSDPDAAKYVKGMAFQWAGKAIIGKAHETWPDLNLIQSENECGDGQNTWHYAGNIFNLFRHYITNGARAYTYWNPILDGPSHGGSHWGWKQNSMVSIFPQPGENYSKLDGDCPNNNIEQYQGKTLAECQDICSSNTECLGFSFNAEASLSCYPKSATCSQTTPSADSNGYSFWKRSMGPSSAVLNPEFYVMNHFSHFVRPGAVRRGLEGEWGGSGLAFESDGEIVVVVANNQDSARNLTLVAGGAAYTAELPAKSFHTLVLPIADISLV